MEEQTATKFNATTIYISTAHRFVECQLPFGCRRCGMDNVRRHFSRMILTTTISKCFVRFVISMDFRSKLNLHFNVGPWIQSNAIVLNTNHIYWSFESFLAEFIRTFWIFHSIFRLFFSILTLRSMKKSPKKDSRLDLFELLHFFSRTVDSKILWNSLLKKKKPESKNNFERLPLNLQGKNWIRNFHVDGILKGSNRLNLDIFRFSTSNQPKSKPLKMEFVIWWVTRHCSSLSTTIISIRFLTTATSA